MIKSCSSIRLFNQIFKCNVKMVRLQTIGYKQCKISLNHKNYYAFVNLPTSSKYYHEQLPTTIDSSMRMAQKQSKLNQKCFLLEHIVQLIEKNPKLLCSTVKQFMIKELTKWKNERGRLQRVASIALIIHKIRLKESMHDLYDQIFERIMNDQWYVDFYEAVKAIEAYSSYPDSEKRNLLFQKIQRNLKISISDFGMTYYQKICLSLIEAERFKSPLWQKLEQFVVRNLSMPYTSRTFFDIFRSFAISQNGTQQFYEICQQVIRKGHLYSFQHHNLRSNLGDFNSSGDYFALMIQTYAIVNTNTPFRLQADFLDYIYKSMLTSRLQYRQISSLTKIIKGMPLLQFYPQQVSKVVYDIIDNKQFTNYESLTDIQQLYFVLEDYLGFIPAKIDLNIENLIVKDLERNILSLPAAVEVVAFILMFRQRNKQIQHKINDSTRLIDSLNKSLQKKYKYLDPQQAKQIRQFLKSTPQLDHHVNHKLFLPKPTQTH